MELWVLFTVLATILWAVSNVIDKYVFVKWVKEPIVPVIITVIIGLPVSLLIYIFHGFSALSYTNIGLAFASGIFYITMIILYCRAVKIEEISKIVPMFYLAPLFVLILATIFLGEFFTPLKYIGIFFLIIGAVLMSSKGLRFSFGKAFWLMIACALFLSVSSVITKYLLGFADFWTIFAYEKIGVGIAIIPVLYFGLSHMKSDVKEHGKRVVGAICISDILTVVGSMLATAAISVGSVTLVNAMTSVQPFFVLLFAVVLSIFYPRILKEEIGKSAVLLKLLAITLMFIGAILIM